MLTGKIAFITGANGGFGKSIIEELVANNVKIICAVRKLDKKFLKFISSKSKNVIEVLEFDINNEKIAKEKIYSLLKKIKKIDILINNAGVPSGSLFEMTSIKNLKNIFETNFFSQINITQILLRFLKKSKGASVINIGSLTGIIPERGTLAYGTSKAALMHATKIMANELSIYKIRVNAIAPSIVKTKMLKMMDNNSKNNLINESYLKRECSLKDVTNLVIFLSSNSSNYINGQVIRIDGGMKI